MADIPSVGQAIGLQSVPTFAMQVRRDQYRMRKGEEAAKRAKEEKEFDILREEFNIDPSKYHRLDRERALKNAQTSMQKAFDMYKSGNPYWSNEARQVLYDYKFQDGQIQVDSKVKFDTEKYVEDSTTYKSPELMAAYNWYKQGNFGEPPELIVDQFGQVSSFDPATGTIGYVPSKRQNLPEFAKKTIYDPARSGYSIELGKETKLPTGETQYIKPAVYNDALVEAGIHGAEGGDQFTYWRLENADRIRQAVAANPTVLPQEVVQGLWVEDMKKYRPNDFQTTIQAPPAPTNININTGKTPLTEQTAGYGQKPVYVYGFTATEGEPLKYGEEYPEGGGTKRFQTTTIDGFTLAGQGVKISGGPNVKYLSDVAKTPTGSVDISLGDMMLVPVYAAGTKQTRGGKEEDIGGIIIPDQQLESAESKGVVKYEVVIMGTDVEENTIYSPAEHVINNATFLKENKEDKVTLKNNLDVLKAKRDELNKKHTKQGTALKTGDKLTYVEWKKQNPNGTVPEYNKYKAQ